MNAGLFPHPADTRASAPAQARREALAYPPASARNMALLVQLRWLAVAGQLAAIGVAAGWLGLPLKVAPLVAVPVLLALFNLATLALDHGRTGYTHAELFGALSVDLVALTWQLHFSGGAGNPFVFLFLLQIMIAAILLPPAWSAGIAALTALDVALLVRWSEPLLRAGTSPGETLAVLVAGNAICFVLSVALVVFFVVAMDRNRRRSDAALAAMRQQAAEDLHIVRLGLLASGAAHELGTPLATMAVLVGDWQHHPALADDDELAADLDDMASELQRCKAIVSGILMSAGAARGENPAVTTLARFMDDLVAEWNARSGGAVVLRLDPAASAPMIADPALRQVLGNLIDNALDVSPDRVEITVTRTPPVTSGWRTRAPGRLVIDVRDHGPGFAPAMLAGFGRPYNSTKGRPGGGLGLFLVVNVVRQLGGSVTATNLPTGGASVRVELPLGALAPPAS